jgi:predicted heme/steroid binding protein
MNRTAVKVLGGAVGGTALFLGYDYNTCHPMRKMQGYSIHGALIRFHNIVVSETHACRIMSLQDVAQFNGVNGRPTYFSAQGWVWDVSSSEMFREAYSSWAGNDATVALAKMSLSADDVNRTDCWKNLTPAELESVQSWTAYFMEKYMIKGRLREYDESPKG